MSEFKLHGLLRTLDGFSGLTMCGYTGPFHRLVHPVALLALELKDPGCNPCQECLKAIKECRKPIPGTVKDMGEDWFRRSVGDPDE